MKKLTVVLGENSKVEGISLNTSLKEFRNQLEKKGFTEINTVYRAGKHIVTFITEGMNRLSLIDAGLIRGSKKERTEYKAKTKDVVTKIHNFGYAW